MSMSLVAHIATMKGRQAIEATNTSQTNKTKCDPNSSPANNLILLALMNKLVPCTWLLSGALEVGDYDYDYCVFQFILNS